MFIFGNFLQAVASILSLVLNAYLLIVIASAVLSWVNPDPYNPIVRFLRAVTEPVFYRVRRMLPFLVVGGFDLTPLVVLLAIQFLQSFLVKTLLQISLGGM